MTKSLPPNMKMFINPSLTIEELRHNFLVGHQRYLEHYTSPRVMVVKSIIDGLNKLTLKKKNSKNGQEEHEGDSLSTKRWKENCTSPNHALRLSISKIRR